MPATDSHPAGARQAVAASRCTNSSASTTTVSPDELRSGRCIERDSFSPRIGAKRAVRPDTARRPCPSPIALISPSSGSATWASRWRPTRRTRAIACSRSTLPKLPVVRPPKYPVSRSSPPPRQPHGGRRSSSRACPRPMRCVPSTSGMTASPPPPDPASSRATAPRSIRPSRGPSATRSSRAAPAISMRRSSGPRGRRARRKCSSPSPETSPISRSSLPCSRR